jgi:TetR/AcrR family transcriptional regulator, transcriptional repressor for nem operon
MRYVKGHGLHTRSRIVEEASYGLRQRGADGLSVVDLMKLAGLTHGGFYAHFESREALVVEAFVLAMDRTIAHWLNLAEELPPEERFDAFVQGYLSSSHRKDRAHGCALPALGADIARSSPKARRTFGRKFGEMIDMVAQMLPEMSPEQARRAATSALATMMGAIVLARAVGDKNMSDDILAAGRQALRRRAAAGSCDHKEKST